MNNSTNNPVSAAEMVKRRQMVQFIHNPSFTEWVKCRKVEAMELMGY